MAGAVDFKGYLNNEHHDLFFNRINTYVINNRDDLDISTGLIERISFAKVDAIHIKFANITDAAENDFSFDIAIEADIEFSGRGDRDYETDSASQWFRLSCSAKLKDGLKEVRINSIDLYSRIPKSDGQILSSAFTPIIKKVEFDDIAESFLTMFCPRALQEPMPLVVQDIAQAMGLSIMDLRITKTLTIFGMTAFGDCTVVYYDECVRGTYKVTHSGESEGTKE